MIDLPCLEKNARDGQMSVSHTRICATNKPEFCAREEPLLRHPGLLSHDRHACSIMTVTALALVWSPALPSALCCRFYPCHSLHALHCAGRTWHTLSGKLRSPLCWPVPLCVVLTGKPQRENNLIDMLYDVGKPKPLRCISISLYPCVHLLEPLGR